MGRVVNPYVSSDIRANNELSGFRHFNWFIVSYTRLLSLFLIELTIGILSVILDHHSLILVQPCITLTGTDLSFDNMELTEQPTIRCKKR